MTSWVKVRAPVRILDAGGWTDTWFAGHGMVCHLCVGPGAEASARLAPKSRDGSATVRLRVPDLDDDYSFDIGSPPGRHPLLEAALRRWAPVSRSLEVSVSCAVPAGSSLGTSAAVVVALVLALSSLGEGPLGPEALAHAAHDIETVDLGRQSGVQDQIAASFGGTNLVRVAPYPEFAVRRLALPATVRDEVARRVVTAYLGSHDSSAVHNAVIEHLTDNPGATSLDAMRAAAERAAEALVRGDLDAYGEAVAANTEAQAALHPELVNRLARKIIETAAKLGAPGWKVNGAGGAGGTVSVIGPDDPGELVRALGSIEGLTLLQLAPAAEGASVVDCG